MLGRLLQTATAPFQGSIPRSHSLPLESIQEEQHTRELLFPDLTALKTAQQIGSPILSTRSLPTPKEAGSYDNRGGLDGITQDDIRVIIAQDTCGRWQSPQILFDSKKDETKGSPRYGDPAKSQSLSARGKSMTSPPQTARRGHTPNTSLCSRPMPSSPSSPSSTRTPEPRGLFGASRLPRQLSIDPFADLETRDEKDETDALLNCMFGAAGFRLHSGTKLHIMPRKTSRSSTILTRPTSSGGTQRRRTPLSRSTSMADGDEGVPIIQDSRSNSSKPSIMITRLFTVSLSDHGGGCTHQRPLVSMEQRRSEEDDEAGEKSVKQKKVPMYAVSIIIHLADEPGSKFRPSQDALFSPTSSPRRAESYFGLHDSRTAPVFDSTLRNHANYVLSHWTMLNRSIEILEHTASHSLRHILQAVPTAPRLDLPASKGTTKNKVSKQQTQQLVYVMPDCLQEDKLVQTETDAATKLVVSALRIRKVAVGQDRWGAWREEARWVGRWATSKEQPAFFYHILTAFLGNHNVWLRSVHTHCRRRGSSHHRAVSNDQVNIRYRTVIVASDKMAARRFIFLLSHFFPSVTGHSSLQSSSLFGQSFSDNPPSFSLSREKSLRRTINGKPRTSFAGQNNGHNRSVSFSVIEQEREDTTDSQEECGYSRTRRGSETQSIRSAALAIPGSSTMSRKASISTVLADSDAPVPHFSALEETSQPLDSPRPSSGGSMASIALSQTLKRRDSSTLSSSGRWGSMVSGFWSNRRDSSTSDQDGSSSFHSSPQKSRTYSSSPQKASRLNQMVDEATSMGPQTPSPFSVTPTRSSAIEDSPPKRPLPRGIPEAKSTSKTQRLPLNINFNEDDGFLDVSLSPGQSFESSFASSFASFRLGTGSPFEHQSMLSSFASDTSRSNSDPTIDVAGWLKTYHPSFTLQAIRPYEELMSEIKQSMRDEASITPTPVEVDLMPGNEWVDICVTLVADTTNFSIQKLRLCRRKKLGLQPDYSYEEKVFVEPVTETNKILTDAVKRILAMSIGPSRSHSRAPSHTRAPSPKPHTNSVSRSHSRPASIRGRTSTSFPDGRPLAADAPHYETRRMILAALEEVVKSVAEDRDEPSGSTDGKNVRKEDNNALRDGVRKWLNGEDEY